MDTIIEHDAGRRLVAVKNVTVNEEFFQGHFPGSPLMPAVEDTFTTADERPDAFAVASSIARAARIIWNGPMVLTA